MVVYWHIIRLPIKLLFDYQGIRIEICISFRFGAVSTSGFQVLLHVHQLGCDLALVAPGVVPVRVLLSFLLSSLLSTMARVHGLFLVVVIMLILVEMLLGRL